MKSFFLTLLILTCYVYFGNAQSSIKGKVIDFDTGEPIPCVNVYLNGGDTTNIETTTNWDGEFSFENVEIDQDYEETYYNISFHKTGYRSDYDDFELKQNDEYYLEQKLYSYESDSFKLEDLAAEDVMDVGIVSFGYMPSSQFQTNFISSIPVSIYNFDFKLKVADFMQLGTRISYLELWYWALNDDLSNTMEANEKERYMQVSASVYGYARFLISKTPDIGGRGLFLDVGAGYRIPYYFGYSYFTNPKTKVTTRGIVNYNNFDAMARLGYNAFAVIATYRLTYIMKDGYIEPPKLMIGLDFPIPTYD